MKIAITGASGFIGARLAAVLRRKGHTVIEVSVRTALQPGDLDNCEAVVNLAGEPVAQRWTASAKDRIRNSRIEGTRTLVKAMAGLSRAPEVLVSASAIGYYGSRDDEVLTEVSPPADDFLGKLAVEWEQEARVAERSGTRVASVRIGVVLGPNGGALAKMLVPF